MATTLEALNAELQALKRRVASIFVGGGSPPGTHATTHQSGGSDPIKLDDLASPDDNTDLNASTVEHGLLPKLGGGSTNFLRADGTWAAPGGSGGDSTHTAAYGSRPAAGNAGDLFLPSDGFYVERDTGSVWAPWGPIFPFTAPVDGDFSWVNQGGASVVTTNGAIHLNAPASGSQSMRIRTKAAPSTPYTITAWFIPKIVNGNFSFFGLGFRESGTGKLQHWRFGYNSGFFMEVVRSSSATADVSNELTTAWAFQILYCLRITDNGTNLIFSYSHDGVNFIDRLSISRTVYMAGGPDEVFWNADTRLVGFPAGATLLSWKQA